MNHFTASGLVLHKNKVLLVNHKLLGVWLYPGGHVEDNETPDEAVVREVKEETGLEVEIVSGKDDSLSDVGAEVLSLHLPYAVLREPVHGHHHNDLVYVCRIVGGEPEKIAHDPAEAHGIGFFGLRDLGKIKLFPNFRRLLEKALRDPVFGQSLMAQIMGK